MLKKDYQKPSFEVVELQIESSIANGSVKVGSADLGPTTPYVEDFNTGETFHSGTGVGNNNGSVGYQDI